MSYYYYYYYDYSGNDTDQTDDYDNDLVLLEEESFTDLYRGCIKASTVQVQQYIVILLGCGLMHRLFWEIVQKVRETKQLYHLISVSCGLLSWWLYVGSTMSYVVLHMIHICLFLRLMVALKVKYTGWNMCAYTIGCQIILECLMGVETYEIIRGPQMLISMKLISVAFDIEDTIESFFWLSIFGYTCSPSTSLLGPWVSFKDYKRSKSDILKRHVLIQVILFISLSVFFLNMSNCIIPWLKHFWDGGLWLRTYLDALAVRCSHYFICYLAHATLLINCQPQGFSISSNSFQVVNPFAIEFPRSLSQVIRHWNIPMHLWLKLHIFQRLRSAKFPYLFAILVTYMISCLVHGFNYRVHLILASLGVFSYFENRFRRILAQVFNACIESTTCGPKCKYFYCPRSNVGNRRFSWACVLVNLVNFMFSLVVILQLAYLGVMLSSNSSLGSSTSDILRVWSHLKYIGHWITLAMALFVLAI